MTLKLYFNNSQHVSAGIGEDMIKMNFVYPPIFNTYRDNINLTMNYEAKSLIPL